MRIRTIKPEFWQSEDLAQCSDKARLLAIGLLNYCDDEGYFNANSALIQAAVFPFDTSSNIPVMLLELSRKAKYVAFGEAEGRKYGQVVNFLEHQVISHPKESKIKGLCQFQYDSGNVPVTFRREGNGKEGNGKEENGKDTLSESFEEVWTLYPDKSGKPTAKRRFIEALKRGVSVESIKAGLRRYIAYVTAKRKTFPELKWQNGSTWFNNGWESEWSLPAKQREESVI